MSFLFGITNNKPSRETAKKMDQICREEGGICYVEVNIDQGATPDINNGRYQGWFVGRNHCTPFDNDLRDRVMSRCRKLGVVFAHD
jgi:hypothetical protein